MSDFRELIFATVTVDGNGVTIVQQHTAPLIDVSFQKTATGTFIIQVSGDIYGTGIGYPYINLTPVGAPQHSTITAGNPNVTSTTYGFTVELYDTSGNLQDGTVTLAIHEAINFSQLANLKVAKNFIKK